MKKEIEKKLDILGREITEGTTVAYLSKGRLLLGEVSKLTPIQVTIARIERAGTGRHRREWDTVHPFNIVIVDESAVTAWALTKS